MKVKTIVIRGFSGAGKRSMIRDRGGTGMGGNSRVTVKENIFICLIYIIKNISNLFHWEQLPVELVVVHGR